MTEVVVSVIIPCYNASEFIEDSLRSVAIQARTDVQTIVVDDGSDDGDELRAAVAAFGESVELIRTPHRGLASARNSGLVAARGRYIAFLDADDEWKPGFLDRQLGELERSGADLVYCDAELFGDEANPDVTAMGLYPSRGDATAAAVLLRRCNVIMSTVVARRDAVSDVNGFDPELPFGEDFDLWLRMLESGSRVVYHREALARRRIHEGNLSRDSAGMTAAVDELSRRHAEMIPLAKKEARQLDRRLRVGNGEVHHSRAAQAIDEGDRGTARRELWRAARADPSLRRITVALGFAVAPGLAIRLRGLKRSRRISERR